ncbi:MAG: SpoIID/LytB domain-containing protein [Clostridia bacterium]|nr:SpoIID/LytB domain-containing protein [Clostridia bacterium]
MKKLHYFAVVLIIFGIFTFSSVNAYANTVRVGLEKNFKNVSSLTVSNESINVAISGGDSYGISGTYTVKPVGNEYYIIGKYFDTYEEAKSKLTDYTGNNCIVALTDDGWTIYIRTDGNKLDFSTIHTGEFCVGFALNGTYQFIVDGTKPAVVSADDGIISLGSNSYRDAIEIYRQGNVLTAINVIDEDKYLYGVINSEMPSSWSKEAQKAQAVAARTYMRRSKGKHSTYDLCDSVHCQDYNGTKNETDAGKQAVDETEGLCIYYDNALIEAVYFSSNGGATLDGIDVWGTETPYLIGKKDNFEKEYKDWERQFTYSELTDMCEARGYNIGNVITVEAEHNDNGIVTSLTFRGSKGSKTITNDEIRTSFSATKEGSLLSRNFVVKSGEKTTATGESVYVIGSAGVTKEAGTTISAENNSGQKGSLGKSFVAASNSSTKRIEPRTIITTGTSGVVTFTGKGNGHSAGMSQYGAKAMAEEGYNFMDILKFYYTGVEVK